ncbi:MAG: hypothetical protein ACYTEG_10680 [Planctomycetota bacterium]
MIRSPRFWIALAAAAVVCSFAVTQLNKTSPGPLATVHSRVAALSGVGSCANCHGGWFGDMTESCLECHDTIASHIKLGKGLHGVLEAGTAKACARCHSDHHGHEFALVNRQSFAAAGVSEPSKFDHGMVGFDMKGAHLETACTECHQQAEAAVLPEGTHRYIGLEQRCGSCHEDPHKGQMIHACTQCHGQTKWEELDSLSHEEYLPLIGGHGDVSCRECHAEQSEHALERLGRGAETEPRSCVACHDSPHREEFVDANAKLARLPLGESCVVCHAAEHTSWRQEGLTISPAQHAASGFAVAKPHHEVACADCHEPKSPEFLDRYPGRGPDECAQCHEDVHRGQFEHKSCLDCHDRLAFEPHTFTVDKHEQTKLALTGRHVETDCAECHKKAFKKAPREFRGVSDECGSCHRDAHRGAFNRFEKELSQTEHGSCAACHSTTSFAESDKGPFEHDRWTGFPLDGAHVQEECEACHKPRPEPDRNKRRFGLVSESFGAYKGCVTCHADPHRGEFRKKKHPQKIEDRTGCARCHVTSSFRTFPDGFDHKQWTGFRLDGQHVKTGCTACHEPLKKPDRSGRTWGRAKGARCNDCHTDPHAGQFTRAGRVSCEKCHESAIGWSTLRFRHNLDARFRLDKAHEKLDCGACHKPEKINKTVTVRFRPLGRRCVDCHSHQKNPLRRRGK